MQKIGEAVSKAKPEEGTEPKEGEVKDAEAEEKSEEKSE